MRGGVQRAPKSHAVPHTHVEASPPPHPSASLQVVIAISLIFHSLISICQTLQSDCQTLSLTARLLRRP